MKSKKMNRKEMDSRLQAAQDFIGPYIDMVFCFTAELEDTERVDQFVSDWAVMACALKMFHPELEILDLLPQNLDKTFDKVEFNEEKLKQVMAMKMEGTSYI